MSRASAVAVAAARIIRSPDAGENGTKTAGGLAVWLVASLMETGWSP